ncbi:MAG TPA: hypothetical protein VFC19_38215 [Candidatus Limnocylindrales bacterium]|nr:hypothetical protein [Candidatus Limnocylindrales bacterium]
MRHRRGTPGLTPYRLRTIEAGYPRRRRPARHRRAAGRTVTYPAHRINGRTAGRALARRTSSRIDGQQVAMGVAGAIALTLLVIGGYQAVF